MHAEFRRISVVRMSNSGLFIVKDEEQGTLKRPPLEFQEEFQGTATSSSRDDQEREELEDHEEKKGEVSNVKAASKESEKNKMTMTMVSLGELKATDDDDDGFKTPTSLDHKIPAIKQCPPAPRKPKPIPSNKRKASSPSNSSSASTRRNLQLSFSQEIESLFPSALLADIHHHKVKKARTQDQNQ